MSDSKQNQNKKWNAETQRDERKARLARMKSRDGGKKPIRTSNKAVTIITSIVLVIAILGIATGWVINVGLPRQWFPALTVGKVDISAAEFNIYYRSLLSNFAIDPTTEAGKKSLKEPCSFDTNFATNEDFFKDMAAQQIQETVILTENAKAEGVALEQTEKDQIASSLENLATTAKTEGQTIENYLISQFGVGVSEAVIKQYLDRAFLASKYSSQTLDTYVFTETEIETYYNDNKATYDIVDYRTFTITASLADGATTPTADALADAKAKAAEMMGKITDQDSFKAECIAYAPEASKESYTTTDKSLVTGSKKADVSNTKISDWLFSTDRAAGNMTVIESTTGATLIYFVDRQINDNPALVDVRHILIEADKATATAEVIATAKAKAESILAQYKAGPATEDAFSALANANSQDPGSNTTGGLYEDITPSSSLVAEFLGWSMDPTHKPGDTGVIQTSYGFHIMYLSKIKDTEWHGSVKSDLTSKKFEDYLTAQKPNYPYAIQSFGMSLLN